VADKLYLLGMEGGGRALQLIAMCELNNRAVLTSKTLTLKPELHRDHANAVLKLCNGIREAIEPIHDGNA
jgi:hypothetical protein